MRAIAPPAGNDKDTVPQHRCSDFPRFKKAPPSSKASGALFVSVDGTDGQGGYQLF